MASRPLSHDLEVELARIAQTIATPGKGILAADECAGWSYFSLDLGISLNASFISVIMTSRFTPMNIDNNEENRRFYRQLLFRTDNISQYLSGIILCHETFYHTTDDDGTPFPQLLLKAGIMPGITVDRGLLVLGGTDDETITQGWREYSPSSGTYRLYHSGLDDLEERCRVYKKLGAQFAKWRALIKISSSCPSTLAINENAVKLARYASVCQQVRSSIEKRWSFDRRYFLSSAA